MRKWTIDMREMLTPQIARGLFDQKFTFNQEVTHEQKVKGIFTLVTMYEAVMKTGDFEHTSDWDWAVIVETKGGTIQLTGIDLPFDDVEPLDHVEEFKRWQFISGDRFDEEEFVVVGKAKILIDDIVAITFHEI